MKKESNEDKPSGAASGQNEPVVMRILKHTFKWENFFYGLSLLMGLNVSPESGVMVLILWQLIKLNDSKAS